MALGGLRCAGCGGPDTVLLAVAQCLGKGGWQSMVDGCGWLSANRRGCWPRPPQPPGATPLPPRTLAPAHSPAFAPLPRPPSLLHAAAFGERFYSSCSDVVYPAANQRAMAFVGG